MPQMIPRKVFFVTGVGTHRSRLGSFENALRSAGIAKYNLVEVSSIFPPYAELIDREEGLKQLKPGQILFLVLARNSSNELNRLVTASIGLAIPRNRTMYGYISEHHSFGEPPEVAGKFAEELAAEMLASTMGLETYQVSEKGEFRLNDAILLTTNVTSSSAVKKKDEWTTVVAAAVMILD
ncbi:MAG: arginine decarboxylase, pyruvoyl-dependent [Thermoplasmatales archaeon]